MTATTRLQVGENAPAFSLEDADGNTVSLSDYRGRKLIVYFYPAAATPGCTKQACDFRDNLRDLKKAGLDVVGISPDKPTKLRSTFVVDENGNIALAQYNVKATGHVDKLRRDLSV